MGEIRITFSFKSVSIWILFGASVQRPCGSQFNSSVLSLSSS